MILWRVNLCHWGSCFALFCFFASLLSFALSSKIQSKICYRDAESIAWIRFALNLLLLRNLQQLCYKVWPSAPRDVVILSIFFNHVNKIVTNGGWYSLKKSDLKGHLGSIVKSTNFWFNNDRQMTRKIQGKVLGGWYREVKWKMWIYMHGRLMKQVKKAMQKEEWRWNI